MPRLPPIAGYAAHPPCLGKGHILGSLGPRLGCFIAHIWASQFDSFFLSGRSTRREVGSFKPVMPHSLAWHIILPVAVAKRETVCLGGLLGKSWICDGQRHKITRLFHVCVPADLPCNDSRLILLSWPHVWSERTILRISRHETHFPNAVERKNRGTPAIAHRKCVTHSESWLWRDSFVLQLRASRVTGVLLVLRRGHFLEVLRLAQVHIARVRQTECLIERGIFQSLVPSWLCYVVVDSDDCMPRGCIFQRAQHATLEPACRRFTSRLHATGKMPQRSALPQFVRAKPWSERCLGHDSAA